MSGNQKKTSAGGMKWVRLYTDLPRHEKVLRLMASPKGREAVGVYAFALAWSGDQRTDGFIPDYAIPVLHASRSHVDLLEGVGLWDRNGAGWHIHNWEQRQDTQAAADLIRARVDLSLAKAALDRSTGVGAPATGEGVALSN